MVESNPVKLPVTFKSVNIGKEAASIGVSISRNDLKLARCDQLFSGHRLSGKITLDRNGDDENQRTLIDDANHVVEGSFDVKKFGTSADDYTVSLSFSKADIDLAELGEFSAGTGTLEILGVEAIPDKDSD